MSESDNRRQSAEALTNELALLCHSESHSESGLSEIIERHELTSNNDDTDGQYKQIFFHYACCNERVNEGIIRLLLEYFPDAAKATNQNG
eukprot:CAMPEP_0201729230 /NCGR_PEP_ID=MMETSP0593-20130828/18406_1 /ASSEMBLY_ACC=CAM_ASM_000672 /TAXON_ID=267983 /ORGANISM="Skeletonema japonicum, Strain CCMP2506" /LENGTH=89 /DNA_ID=CAMNT_0048221541 /DNA_START=42 /DNA_END=308 /DNA_ORIENTATION=+